MNFFYANNIYFIPTGGVWGLDADVCYMVYSPLADKFFLAQKADIENLTKLNDTEKLKNNIIQELLDYSHMSDVQEYVINPHTLRTLYIIVNEKCNFSCSYCYSAKGRSNAEISMEQLRPILEFFIDKNRVNHEHLSIMFIGGGEPTLSWNIIEDAVAFANNRAKQQGITLSFSLSTNGSILNDAMITFFKQHNFTIQFSFDVLPDVQNSQRGNFEKVYDNLKKIETAGISARIRATITSLNAHLIKEMIIFCHENFPYIKKISCEPVVTEEMSENLLNAKDFYATYTQSFMDALKVAQNFSIQLFSSCSGAINMVRKVFCGGIYCVTPYSTISYCPHVASPVEDGYEQMVFGNIEKEKVYIFNEKFNILNTCNDNSQGECSACWARWNCGGGCPNKRRVFSKEMMQVHCEHTKAMLLQMLLQKLAAQYQESTGNNFWQEMAAALGGTYVAS